jgi:hypothetical protein
MVLLVFLGLSALPSGLFMVIGGTDSFPEEWVEAFPVIDSLLAPGLVLLLGFGVGSLVTAYGVWRRPRWAWLAGLTRWSGRHWSWLATVLLGLGQMIWIALELVYLPQVSFLQPLYGGVGVALFAIAWHPAVRAYLALPDHPLE